MPAPWYKRIVYLADTLGGVACLQKREIEARVGGFVEGFQEASRLIHQPGPERSVSHEQEARASH
jgi:hypothetical protein